MYQFKIQMINVGFGDCLLFENYDKQDYLLVDCGSKSFKNSLSKYKKFDDLVAVLQDQFQHCTVRHSALITHFHEDHYNGFRKWHKRLNPDQESKKKYFSDGLFDTIYVPYILVKKKEKENYLVKLLTAYYILFPERSPLCQQAKNVFEQIKVLSFLSKNANVQPLGHSSQQDKCQVARSSFTFGERQFDVIWPDVDNPEAYDNVMLNLYEIFEEMTAQMEVFHGLDAVQKTIIHNFTKWYDLNLHEDEHTDKDKDKDKDPRKEKLVRIIQSQDGSIEQLDTIKAAIDKLSPEDKEKLSRLKFTFKSLAPYCSQNAISVVFHDSEKCLSLMLGDIERKIFEDVLVKAGRISTGAQYDAIKVAHHGTAGYFSNKLPKARCYLISNGKCSNWKISCKYRTYKNGYDQIKCTAGDTSCEAHEQGDVCPKGKCHNDCASYLISGGV